MNKTCNICREKPHDNITFCSNTNCDFYICFECNTKWKKLDKVINCCCGQNYRIVSDTSDEYVPPRIIVSIPFDKLYKSKYSCLK